MPTPPGVAQGRPLAPAPAPRRFSPEPSQGQGPPPAGLQLGHHGTPRHQPPLRWGDTGGGGGSIEGDGCFYNQDYQDYEPHHEPPAYEPNPVQGGNPHPHANHPLPPPSQPQQHNPHPLPPPQPHPVNNPHPQPSRTSPRTVHHAPPPTTALTGPVQGQVQSAAQRRLPNGYRSSSPSTHVHGPPHTGPHKVPPPAGHPRGPRKGLHEPYSETEDDDWC